MKYLVVYTVAVVVFGAMDAVWLGWAARDLYRNAIGEIMAKPFDMKVAVAFYLIYIAGLVFFGIQPGMAADDWRVALVYGGLFGFFCYATYDLTNAATLAAFPLRLGLIDMAWGSFVSAATSGISLIIVRLILRAS
jgi:uncharacterized membrane protein